METAASFNYAAPTGNVVLFRRLLDTRVAVAFLSRERWSVLWGSNMCRQKVCKRLRMLALPMLSEKDTNGYSERGYGQVPAIVDRYAKNAVPASQEAA